MTLRSEECTSERWTTRFGSFFPFFLAAGVQRGQFATKVMLLAGIRRRAVVTPSFIEVLRPFKAGEVESVNFYKVAAVSLCCRWTVLVHKYATLWSVAHLKDLKKLQPLTPENKLRREFYEDKLHARHARRASCAPDAHMRP